MTFIHLLLLAVLSGVAYGQTSYVSPTQTLRKKGYQIGIEGDLFTSSQKVDGWGTSFDFTDGESFQRIQAEMSGYYGFTNELQVGIGARYRVNDSTLLDVNGNQYSATSSGIQSTFVNLKYAFKPVDQLQYTIEGTYRFTPYTNVENNTNASEMILGEDGHETSAGLGVTYNFKSNDFLTARAGYRRPGQDISDEIYWQLEGAMAWRYLAVVAGVDGVTSLNRDPYSDAPLEKPAVNVGSTLLYRGFNREWIAPYAGLNIALGSKWRIDLRASQVVSGQSTDLGTAFGFQLVRRVDKKSLTIDSKFKSYDIESTISKLSPQKGYVVIDKGLTGGVQKGMNFDFFEFDYIGGNILIARGVVIQSKAETAVVKITQRYNTKKEIKEGLVGRASLK